MKLSRIAAYAGITISSQWACYKQFRHHRPGFDVVFDLTFPFCVVEHWKLTAELSEDCLSAASSAAPAVS